jgi:hypothetical protein
LPLTLFVPHTIALFLIPYHPAPSLLIPLPASSPHPYIYMPSHSFIVKPSHSIHCCLIPIYRHLLIPSLPPCPLSVTAAFALFVHTSSSHHCRLFSICTHFLITLLSSHPYMYKHSHPPSLLPHPFTCSPPHLILTFSSLYCKYEYIHIFSFHHCCLIYINAHLLIPSMTPYLNLLIPTFLHCLIILIRTPPHSIIAA